jgi:hypothetical protein
MPYLPVFKNINILLFLLILFCYSTSFSQNINKQNQTKNIHKTKLNHKKINKNRHQKKTPHKKLILQNLKSITDSNIEAKDTSLATDYFFEIELDQQNCDNTIVSKCFFADSLFAKPYFHPTTLHIFNNKILATQLFYHKNSIQKTYPKIIDKNNFFSTTNHNKISFVVFNGNIKQLNLSSTINENKATPCLFADKLFLHQQIYSDTKTQDVFFKNSNNSELKQLSMFSANQQQYALLYNNKNNSWLTIDNLILCQNKKENNQPEILWQKTFNQQQCATKLACLTQTETEEQSKEECKKLNNVDIEICFQQEKCQEVIEINNCQIILNTFSNK